MHFKRPAEISVLLFPWRSKEIACRDFRLPHENILETMTQLDRLEQHLAEVCLSLSVRDGDATITSCVTKKDF